MSCTAPTNRFSSKRPGLATAGLLFLTASLSGCGGSLPFAGFLSGLPGVGLLTNVANSPLGNAFTLLGDLLKPPPNPFDNEINASFMASANSKFIVDEALPQPVTPLVLAQLDAQPNYSVLGPNGLIYYTEKDTGRVRVFNPATATISPTVVLDLAVNNSGTRGLKGITFSTDGARMILTYDLSATGADSSAETEAFDARLVSYPFAGGAITGGETVLWATSPRDAQFPSDINGIGPCVVAPDGFLYLGHGDRNSRLTALEVTNDNQPSGKILRFNQDGTIPDANPTKGKPTFCVGFRDPTAFAFDRTNGLFWILDESSGVSDELNLGAPGLTYGWPALQGNANTEFETNAVGILTFLYHDPIIDFGSTKVGPRGMVVNRGGPYGADTEGDVFLGQSATLPSVLWRYRITNDFILKRTRVFDFPETGGRIRDLVAGPDGRIYVFCANELFVLNPG